MKNFTKFLAIAILGLCLSVGAFGQVTESAVASAEIVTALTLNNTSPLSFGKFAKTNAVGTLALSVGGALTEGGSITPMGGVVSAAAFDVSGDANEAFDITVPTSILISFGGTDITVDTFVASGAGTGTLDASGDASFTVGATLHIVGTELSGVYTGSFDVSVNYQ